MKSRCLGQRLAWSSLSLTLGGLLLFEWGCTSSSPPISVFLSPSIANVHVNKTVQFTATVRNSDNSGVTWTLSSIGCSGAECGTITSDGFYTAPSAVPSNSRVVVKAQSMADPSISGSASIMILPAVELSVSPAERTVAVASSLKFTTTVQNAIDSSVVWEVSGPGCSGEGCGTISSIGIYTAPSEVPSSPTVTVTARSVEDPAASASTTVLVALSCISIEWAWIAGYNGAREWANYGTQGVPSPTNHPGARDRSVTWVGPAGALWLFGGRGLTTNAVEGFLNDLWRFDTTASVWTWISGSSSRDQSGSYGIRGTSDPTNVPGARYSSLSWLDASGNFWLFGGYGVLIGQTGGGWSMANDLWRYDPVASLWTWVSGSSVGDQPGEYGTKGLSDPANVPGSRREAVTWIDPGGDLWLFGGEGFDSGGSRGILNDLWMYDISQDEWTWISGSDAIDQPGVYGTRGVSDPSNVPGGRYLAVSWVDLSGNLWLFGGMDPEYNYHNDLWKFDRSTREWIWEAGSDSISQVGVYGTLGISDPANVPGSRASSISFRDSEGHFWLFGGGGYDSAGEVMTLNDLWMFDPMTLEWTWASGSRFGNQPGVYGTKGEVDPSNVPRARTGAVSWVDAADRFWLFGGRAYHDASSFMNDLWQGIR